jgi:hypothetical protein
MEARTRSDSARVHACVPHAEIADQEEIRLVIIDPADIHSSKNMDSAAIKAAIECLNNRGTSPRLMRDTLFLAASARSI